MKPRNFPARKKARQLAAEYRKTQKPVYPPAGLSCREPLILDMPEVQQARAIRTKKRRAG